jgi:hypothetical protein
MSPVVPTALTRARYDVPAVRPLMGSEWPVPATLSAVEVEGYGPPTGVVAEGPYSTDPMAGLLVVAVMVAVVVPGMAAGIARVTIGAVMTGGGAGVGGG